MPSEQTKQYINSLNGYIIQDKELTDAVDALKTTVNNKAEDTDVVHKTGDESIAGNKTFTGAIEVKGETTISKLGISDAKIENSTITIGENTITPVVSINNKTGTEGNVSITASDLGISFATDDEVNTLLNDVGIQSV